MKVVSIGWETGYRQGLPLLAFVCIGQAAALFLFRSLWSTLLDFFSRAGFDVSYFIGIFGAAVIGMTGLAALAVIVHLIVLTQSSLRLRFRPGWQTHAAAVVLLGMAVLGMVFIFKPGFPHVRVPVTGQTSQSRTAI